MDEQLKQKLLDEAHKVFLCSKMYLLLFQQRAIHQVVACGVNECGNEGRGVSREKKNPVEQGSFQQMRVIQICSVLFSDSSSNEKG